MINRSSAFVVLVIKDNKAQFYFRIKHNNWEKVLKFKDKDSLFLQIKKLMLKEGLKVVAMKIIEEFEDKSFHEKLWLDLDIVPYYSNINRYDLNDIDFERIVNNMKKDFGEFFANKTKVDKYNKVLVHDFLVSIDKYKSMYDDNYSERFDCLLKDFKERGLSFMFINSTTLGGGVALMRHAVIRFFRLFELDVDWYIMSPNPKVFEITKRKFHNILQGVYSEGYELTTEDKKIYESWIEENYINLKNIIKDKDAIIIDDPQPSGLISYIKKDFPDIAIIYRSHIQIDTSIVDDENSVNNHTWKYLYKNISLCDVFISHPVRSFLPKDVDRRKVIYMPATTDPFDGLNKNMSDEDYRYYFEIFNKMLQSTGQSKLEYGEEYITQIARFDPSKGIFDLLESYKEFRELLLSKGIKKYPKLVITGNGASDDPEGMLIFNKILLKLRDHSYIDYIDDIKVAIVPFRDQILNTIMSKSIFALQLSHREGFEIKVTEALMDKKPVIVFDSGGLPLQVKDGIDGFIVRGRDKDKVAEKMFELYTNKKLYSTMCKSTVEYNRDYLTMSSCFKWLYIVSEIVTDKSKDLKREETLLSFHMFKK